MEHGPVHVLLVEDDPAVVDIIALAVERASTTAAKLAHASSLQAALALAEARPFDVVLLDLNLPDSRGIETLERAKGAFSQTPVIVITGAGNAALAAQCLQAGASDFVDKGGTGLVGLQRVLLYALDRRHRAEIAELRDLLERERKLSSQDNYTSVTRALAGTAPISERAPHEFRTLVEVYRGALDDYLEHLVVTHPKPEEGMEQIATTLGDLGAGPRDLVDLHLRALEHSLAGSTGNRASAYAYDARLFALELMGSLVEYYRVGARHPKGG